MRLLSGSGNCYYVLQKCCSLSQFLIIRSFAVRCDDFFWGNLHKLSPCGRFVKVRRMFFMMLFSLRSYGLGPWSFTPVVVVATGFRSSNSRSLLLMVPRLPSPYGRSFVNLGDLVVVCWAPCGREKWAWEVVVICTVKCAVKWACVLGDLQPKWWCVKVVDVVVFNIIKLWIWNKSWNSGGIKSRNLCRVGNTLTQTVTFTHRHN